MLQSDLLDQSDAYILVEGTVSVIDPNNNPYDKTLAFRNNAQFISCILKINNTLADSAENLDIVMLMHNLTECSKNYSNTSGNL